MEKEIKFKKNGDHFFKIGSDFTIKVYNGETLKLIEHLNYTLSVYSQFEESTPEEFSGALYQVKNTLFKFI